MVTTLASNVAGGKRVFAVVGGTHFVMQELAIRASCTFAEIRKPLGGSSKPTPLDTAQAAVSGGLFSCTCRSAGEIPFETPSLSLLMMRATLDLEIEKVFAI